MAVVEEPKDLASAFDSPTFGQDVSFRLDKPVGSASISPCGRDVVLASRQGLHIIDLDSPYSPPRHLSHYTPWEVADVQWSPFAARDFWVVSTSNQKALVWNLAMVNARSSVEHVLHAHTRAITDINFSAHHPDILATCAVDSFVHCWDLRHPARPAMTFCDWFAGATQVKWNRQNSHILASSHDKFLRIWDDRKGAYPLRSIEAHATKIYGVDWNRLETKSLVTCSLDKTIKFWDYTKDIDEPDHVLRTPFPVWRARHTPFGLGLLAMPQRGDHDLHLYDRRVSGAGDGENIVATKHKFDGHDDQVKEFLWRPRGIVTSSIDDREFQLVSWGADRMLRLHQVNEKVLSSVAYTKGMEFKRTMNITRKDATYRTFREDPSKHVGSGSEGLSTGTGLPNGPAKVGMRSALTIGISRAQIPFIGGYGSGGFMNPVVGKKSAAPKEMDAISWMRGVKIGKQDPSQSGLHHSVSSIMSPSLKTDQTWDIFESLGEEITHVGDKFAKVIFDEIDMQRRKIVVSMSGPWGPGNDSTYIKARIVFPSSYPNAGVPIVSLEKTAMVSDEMVTKISKAISDIAVGFVSRQRSSLETILRYLLGEQSLEDCLRWLSKRHESVELDSVQDLDLSSSDEEDENLGRYVTPQADGLETSDPMIAVSTAQYNVPIPKACGAYWAEDGRLVCFFPHRQEREYSLLDMSMKASDRSSGSRKTVFEGFGRLHNESPRQKRPTSTLETIESGDSDIETSSTSSAGSSLSSEDIALPRHHFMPSMAWRGDVSEAHRGFSVDESQRSSGDLGNNSTASKSNNFVSIHDCKDLLPSKRNLAQKYIIGGGSRGSAHNAQVARECGNLELADVWLLIKLILEEMVPLQLVNHLWSQEPIMVVARRAVSPLRATDSAIDLSFDATEEELPTGAKATVKWGEHPLGCRWIVDSLFCHYEQLGDVQMLAMLSCVFSEPRSPSNDLRNRRPRFESENSAESRIAALRDWNNLNDYYPSERVARSLLRPAVTSLSVQVDSHKMLSGPQSANSSTGLPSDFSTSSTPPSSYKHLRISFERRDSQATSLSTSPEQHRHVHRSHRSNSNIANIAAQFSRPFTSATPISSSPPTTHPRKRLSPAGSYLGNQSATNNWTPSGLFCRPTTITEDPRSTFSLSVSDTEEDIPAAPKRHAFRTKLKNQDRFQNDGYADVPMLDPQQEWRYQAYGDAYAHLLYVWEMPMARCEVLNHNHRSALNPSTTSRPKPALEFVDIGKGNPTDPASNTDGFNLTFHTYCRSCSATIPLKSATRRCENCSTAQAPPFCILCNSFIRGLSSNCLNCGHALHAACRNFLLSQSTELIPTECISGCGCICSDYTTIEMPIPDQKARRSYEASPALTVICASGTNEQEQTGWQNVRDLEDVAAYESLARNLRPRDELRPKGSQIWRGRKGSR